MARWKRPRQPRLDIRFRTTLREGRELRFPFCCRWRYALEEAIRLDPEQAVERGVRRATSGIEYVPCGIRHEATVTHREHEHLLNIRALRCRS
jgi:hypothetical protein